jgi:hypothetical protein
LLRQKANARLTLGNEAGEKLRKSSMRKSIDAGEKLVQIIDAKSANAAAPQGFVSSTSVLAGHPDPAGAVVTLGATRPEQSPCA